MRRPAAHGSRDIRATRSILRGGVKSDLGDDVAGNAEVGLVVLAMVDEFLVLLLLNFGCD